MKKNDKMFVYIPHDAELNFENTSAEPPKTKYEERKMTFDKEAVKKVVRGNYGKDEGEK